MKSFVKIIITFILLLGCLMGLSINIFAANATTVNANISGGTGKVTNINYSTKNGNIFYLPGYIDITKVPIETNCSEYKCGSSTYSITNGYIDITKGKATDKYGHTCYIVEIVNDKTYTFYSGSEIGAVFVSTSGGINPLLSNKEYRDEDSQIVITDNKGEIIYNDVSLEATSEIKGRGNASYANEKKPFQIKLGKKTDLFGMGKAKTWILLANYNDASYIRNMCAFKIAEAIGLPFTPQSVFVDLYIDGQYQGLYQLCEKTQVGTNRIEITDLEDATEKLNKDKNYNIYEYYNNNKVNSTNLSCYSYANWVSPEDITGGYLIELDNLYSGFNKETSVFQTNNGNTYTVKSPEVATKDEMDYIANLFSDFEQALYNENGYSDKGIYYTEYCDLESLVKVYLVEEITKNWDAYIGSIYFYKDVDSVSTKIYAGPVWDFDNTWGNLIRYTFNSNKIELWAVGTNPGGYKADFGYALMQHQDAQELATQLYPQIASFVESMLEENGYIDILTNTLEASANMDTALYPVARRNTTFIYFDTYKDGTTNSAVGYLTDFMTIRTDALYNSFGAERPATQHIHNLQKISGVNPTCIGVGYEEYYICTSCGKMYSDINAISQIDAPREISALGHNWSSWTVQKEATEEEMGVEIRFCTNDPTHTETREIPKKEKVETTEVTESTVTTEPTIKETESTTISEPITTTEIVNKTNKIPSYLLYTVLWCAPLMAICMILGYIIKKRG